MWQQVGVAAHLVHVHAVFLPVRQAAPDEGLQGGKEARSKSFAAVLVIFPLSIQWKRRFAANLGFVTGNGFDGKLDVGGF